MADLELAFKELPTPPHWLVENHADAAQEIAQALNSRMHKERWKYTKPKAVLDLLPLPVVQPSWGELPPGVTLRTVDRDSDQGPTPDAFDDAPEAWATVCYHKTVDVLEVKEDAQLSLSHASSSVPLFIRVAKNTTLVLNEDFVDTTSGQHTLWLELAAGSQVTHSRNSFSQAEHWQFLRTTINRDATYTLHNHVAGAASRRQDIQVVCAETGAFAKLHSAAFVGHKAHLDQQVTIEHRAPNTNSDQVFHNIAAGKAKVTFNGRIHIHANAPKVDAQLSNKNLAIGNSATINTKPELEIYTDDVSCAHGATVGQLDPQHEFYAASRGIDPQQARALLAQAFLNVCTGGVMAETAREYFMQQQTVLATESASEQ